MAITPIPGLTLPGDSLQPQQPLSNIDTEFQLLLNSYKPKTDPASSVESAPSTSLPQTLQVELDRAALAYNQMQIIQRRLVSAYQQIQDLP